MAGYIGSKVNVSQIDGYVKSEVDTLLGQELNLSGGSMTGHLNFGDNIKSQYGAGTDLQIYHDASHSYIKDAGTGSLRLSATTIELMKVDTSELMASFAQDGAVTLYYDNAVKLATATGGVDVTGNIVVSGTVDGIDIAARDAVLTSTTTTAGAALPKAGGTMTGNLTAPTVTSGAHLVNASSSAFAGSSVQGFNTDFLVDTGQGYSRHNSYHTGGSNHQFLVNATSSTTNTVALAIDKDANATFAGTVTANYGTTASYVGTFTNTADNLELKIGTTTGGLLNIQGANASSNAAYQIALNAEGGNVGIGNSSPDAWLTVSKDNNNSGNQFYVSDTEGSTAAIRTYTYNGTPAGLVLNHYYAQAGSGNEYMRYADIVANIGTGAGTTMRFITKNAANTYSTTVIDNNGNVGIGTASPDYLLDIENTSGNAMARLHSGTNGSSSLRLQNDAQHFDVNLQTNDKFAIYDHTAGTQPFTIMPTTGNVGIGTTSPAQNFVVAEATNQHGVEISPGTTSYIQAYDRGAGDYGDLRIDAQTIRFGLDNGLEKVTFLANGNVGIGTSSPSTMLHIENSSGNASAQLTSGTSGTSYINMGDTGNVDAGQISYINSVDAMAFTAGAAERMRIDSSGRVGIGTSVAPAQKLTVTGVSGSNVGGLTNGILALTTGTGAIADTRLLFGIVDDSYGWIQAADYGVAYRDISLNPNGGKVGIGSATNPVDLFYITGAATSTAMGIKIGTNGYNGIEFDNATGSLVGRITINSGTTAYVTSSDYRLKENVTDMTGATTRLKQLKPKRFNWIADDTNTLIDGFLAHEVSSIVPEAVAGEKDAVHPEGHHEAGEIDPQGIDHSKLVPLLVKTIQELEARLTAGGL